MVKQFPEKSKLESETKESVEEKVTNKMEIACQIFIVMVLCYLVSIWPSLENMRRDFRAKGVDQQLSLTLWIIPGYLFSFGLFLFFNHVLSKPLGNILSVEHFREESIEARKTRVSNLGFGFTYYLCSSILLFYLGHKSEFEPKGFGGSIDIGENMANWPYVESYKISVFYMLALGHHLERFVKEILYNFNDSNFWTMIFHHFLTLMLIWLSFYMRHTCSGIAVMFIHDTSDILIYFCRFAREVRGPFNTLAFIIFIPMICFWFYSRVYIFAKEIIYNGVFLGVPRMPEWSHSYSSASFFFLFALSLLMILNVFWLFQMVSVLISRFIFKKKRIGYIDRTNPKKN